MHHLHRQRLRQPVSLLEAAYARTVGKAIPASFREYSSTTQKRPRENTSQVAYTLSSVSCVSRWRIACDDRTDPCLYPAAVDCGDHGTCVEGSCVCTGAYIGSDCQTQLPCCSGQGCYYGGQHCGPNGGGTNYRMPLSCGGGCCAFDYCAARFAAQGFTAGVDCSLSC
eukprot:COSAG06_NODE_357_length_16856_cov_7.212687_3_plen_168_part_00